MLATLPWLRAMPSASPLPRGRHRATGYNNPARGNAFSAAFAIGFLPCVHQRPYTFLRKKG